MRLVVLLAVIALAVLGYRDWGFRRGGEAQAPAPPAPTVTVAKPLVKEMEEWSDFTGQFEARELVEVRARVSGYLESVNFVDGQLVKKGDLLFVIEPEALRACVGDVQGSAFADRGGSFSLPSSSSIAPPSSARMTTPQRRPMMSGFRRRLSLPRRGTRRSPRSTRRSSISIIRGVTAPVSRRMGRHEVSVGNLVMGGTTGSTTLLTTIVSLDPIWLIVQRQRRRRHDL